MCEPPTAEPPTEEELAVADLGCKHELQLADDEGLLPPGHCILTRRLITEVRRQKAMLQDAEDQDSRRAAEVKELRDALKGATNVFAVTAPVVQGTACAEYLARVQDDARAALEPRKDAPRA